MFSLFRCFERELCGPPGLDIISILMKMQHTCMNAHETCDRRYLLLSRKDSYRSFQVMTSVDSVGVAGCQ